MSEKSVTVQRLVEASRPALRRHFLSLDGEDVRLRFGVTIPPAAIDNYVDRIDFDTDAVFGVHDDELA
ncbi:MAG TPA: GNAT family N-acetyltransferase, partial [Casimicrobiaceae bacterium]|nr:GNAT family N-acetyltransferase [Casimicrobiaceae bacterium]